MRVVVRDMDVCLSEARNAHSEIRKKVLLSRVNVYFLKSKVIIEISLLLFLSFLVH